MSPIIIIQHSPVLHPQDFPAAVLLPRELLHLHVHSEGHDILLCCSLERPFVSMSASWSPVEEQMRAVSNSTIYALLLQKTLEASFHFKITRLYNYY